MMKETQNGQIMNGEIIFYVLSGRFGNNGLFATKDCSHMFNLGSFSMLQAKCPANNWSYQFYVGPQNIHKLILVFKECETGQLHLDH